MVNGYYCPQGSFIDVYNQLMVPASALIKDTKELYYLEAIYQLSISHKNPFIEIGFIDGLIFYTKLGKLFYK